MIVKNAGFLSTVQDIGRFGFQRYGIPQSGPMDALSFRMANLLVGNDKDEGAIEITGGIFEALFDDAHAIAICGGEPIAFMNGKEIKAWRTVSVKNGDLLKLSGMRKGFRVYLAVGGGVKVEKIFKSKSTCLPAKFGGFKGRRLMAGDVIEFGNGRSTLEKEIKLAFEESSKIRIVKGPQWEYLRNADEFLSSRYKITSDSDRIGYRLDGRKLNLSTYDIISEGIANGTIQVAGNGLPIIMMADHQTTGGYPKIANVISADMPTLGQKKPGDEIEFELIDFETARKLYIEQALLLRSLEYDLLKTEAKSYLIKVNGAQFRVEVKGVDG